ncbi:SA1320 family protein [Pseudalkalibacillus hwajinpoensis]|uniref:Uncharacterized protein n=1 Tax=Guptibacillus hwajinpoensis TaxID=208199 RepID=A0A4U1MJ87_9BACL|nr:hypothetical protein [Pseudalkalibacillus hwajinpoensis]TKD70791.1 hypothetical protein FBF83_09260 [Pseudalkalibacillus hwajinpoensis]
MKAVQNNNISDKDLVELSGFHAYRELFASERFQVNENTYEVIDRIIINSSGLNAITVQKVTDDINSVEIAVIYVGTDPKNKQDVITDLQLIGADTPQQLKDAGQYFNDMEEKFGEISYVAGNSLGGALANSIAVKNKDVKSVTLNPAILPGDLIDPTNLEVNSTNYFMEYDPLTNGEEALGLGYRIPGKAYRIGGGTPTGSLLLGANHTGYLDGDMKDQQVEVGVKGEPGYGFIRIGADEHIVTSIWTGESLHAGNSSRIELNAETIDTLYQGIFDLVANRLSLSTEYIGNSVSIVEDERAKFEERVTNLKETFSNFVEDLTSSPVLKGITSTGYLIQVEIENMRKLLYMAEDRFRGLNSYLNSPPAEIAEHIFKIDVSVESIFGDIQRKINEMESHFEDLVQHMTYIRENKLPELFEGGTDYFYDAIVGELASHYEIINQNKDLLSGQIMSFGTSVSETAASLFDRDLSLAASIESKVSQLQQVKKISKIEKSRLIDSEYLPNGLSIKEKVLEEATEKIVNAIWMHIIPPLSTIKGILSAFGSMLQALINSIRYIQVQSTSSLPVKLLGLFSSFDEKINEFVSLTINPLEQLLNMVEGLEEGTQQLLTNFPELIDRFKPYIDTALFNISKYEDVRLYNLSSTDILEEMTLLFSDVINQLSHQKAVSVDALVEASEQVVHNLKLLHTQVERGTVM